MEPLKDLCHVLEQARTEQTEVERKISEEIRDVKSALFQAQKDIIEGVDTTGDTLEDGMIVVYGSYLADSPEVMENFADITRRLEGKDGEPVLVITRWLQNPAHIGHSRLLMPSLQSNFNLGILNGASLVFDKKKMSALLPTSKYAQIRTGHIRQEDEQIFTDNLTIANMDMMMDGVDLGFNLHTSFQENISAWEIPFPPNPALTIAIGYQEIRDSEKLMIDHYEDPYIKQLFEKLGI